MEKLFFDRRKLDRYSIKGDALARFKSHSSKMGQITNISKGGLTVRYIENRNITKDRPRLWNFIKK